MNYSDVLKLNVSRSIDAKRLLISSEELLAVFQKIVDKIVEAYEAGGRLYIAGNGGSAADAQHLAAEFVSKLARDRQPLPAEALTTDSSILTAIGNDYGYQYVFSRQLVGKLQTNDVFLGITTSGNSANIVEALKACRERKATSIVLSGRGGGQVKALADYCLVVPGEYTSQIQEAQLVVEHTICECVEKRIGHFA